MTIAPRQYAQALYDLNRAGKLTPEAVRRFVVLVMQRGDPSLLKKVIIQLEQLFMSQSSVGSVMIESAGELTEIEVMRLVKHIQSAFKKESIKIEQKNNESLLGGIKITVDKNIVIDGSYRRFIQQLEN